MSLSPQLRAMPFPIRLLAVVIDVAATSGWPITTDDPNEQTISEHPLVESARLVERAEQGDGWRGSHAEQRLAKWGVADQHGVYLLAGLTKRQAEVAFLFYDRCLRPKEIAGYLGIDPITVRLHLHKAEERLRRLAA